ncbi:beta-lactamase family protein [Paenalcaligenes niemegkensis]|uniref:serine hydrolase domain-containing protein n=1 Tax=Paenalcaligenes niemegkensis TaxID=2895469 RepID=UPI001EE78A18|nr:serine hydrolase domain-containing protein [Paenalcaligenes niemegkensis]MCQ9616489.1 beta-lactamase family protein [Paenalcaligenes niemegkensis]
MRFSLAIAAAGLLFNTFVSSLHAEPSPVEQAVDAVIDKAIADQRIVGTVVLVADKGQIVYRRAAGYADREKGLPMQEDSVFRLASMTKPLVSAAALRLVEQGVLDLQVPVTRWLPDFSPRLPDGRAPVITIHQLLTHTSGLSYGFLETEDGPYHQAGVSDGMDLGPDLEENLQRIASVPLIFSPGTDWRYSVSLDVLGGVLSAAAGQSLPDVLRQQVTGPLKMDDTHFVAPEPERLVTQYQDGRPQPVKMAQEAIIPFGFSAIRMAPARALDKTAFPSGGAGMVGTAHDFMRFLLSLRENSHSILKSQTKGMMMKDQTGPQVQRQNPGWGFGYGWAVLDEPGQAYTPQGQGTIQWGGVYGHSWFFDPANDLAVVALTNTAFEGMSGAFPGDLRDALYEELK